MSAPKGLGWWVAFERAITDGPKAVDVQHAIDVCKATGAEWICVRASAGGNDDADLNAQSIAAYVAAGLQVVIWIFDYATSEAAELVDFKRYRDLGVTHAVLNAEYEYFAASEAQARGLVAKLRAMGFEWIAHAPPDYAGGRGDGPLKALDEVCDAIMPQTYAYEHNDQGHVHHIRAVMSLYSLRGFGPSKVWPILGGYRPRTRGYGADKKPLPTPPMADEANRVAADVVAGLDECERMGVPAPSIYTIDALHFINAAVGAAVLAAVTAWAEQRMPAKHEPGPSFPDTAATPITWADRAEQRAEHEVSTDPGTPRAKSTSSQRMKAVQVPPTEPPPVEPGAIIILDDEDPES